MKPVMIIAIVVGIAGVFFLLSFEIIDIRPEPTTRNYNEGLIYDSDGYDQFGIDRGGFDRNGFQDGLTKEQYDHVARIHYQCMENKGTSSSNSIDWGGSIGIVSSGGKEACYKHRQLLMEEFRIENEKGINP